MPSDGGSILLMSVQGFWCFNKYAKKKPQKNKNLELRKEESLPRLPISICLDYFASCFCTSLNTLAVQGSTVWWVRRLNSLLDASLRMELLHQHQFISSVCCVFMSHFLLLVDIHLYCRVDFFSCFLFCKKLRNVFVFFLQHCDLLHKRAVETKWGLLKHYANWVVLFDRVVRKGKENKMLLINGIEPACS